MSLFGKLGSLLSSSELPEEKQLEISESFPFGMCLVDTNNQIEAINSKFVNLCGLENKESLLGRSIKDIALFQKFILDDMRQQEYSGTTQGNELNVGLSGSGSEVFFKYFVVPLSGSRLILLEDISELKRVQKDVGDYISKLRLEQSRLSASINSLPLGFIILDYKNNIMIKNAAVDTILDLKDFEGSVFLRGDMANISDKLRQAYDLDIKSEECMRSRENVNSGDIIFGSCFERV